MKNFLILLLVMIRQSFSGEFSGGDKMAAVDKGEFTGADNSKEPKPKVSK